MNQRPTCHPRHERSLVVTLGSFCDVPDRIRPSSGNLGVSLSMICAAKGYRFTCVTDPLASEHNLILMRAAGACVIKVDERDESGGYLGTRIRCIEEHLKADPDLVWTNQYANTA